ncbi:divalent cation transporter [bacterium]|nr:divalent cation transporter [bacterium]
MGSRLEIVLYSSAAGIPIIIGGLLASLLNFFKFKYKKELVHFITAFGGGALLSAIAFVLIPKAILHLSYFEMIVIFLSGTIFFMYLDILSSKIGGSIAQVLSMMMDFIPEALALGASFAYNHNFGLLIALFIGLQNLPEGFNAYFELNSKMSRKKTLILMLFLSFVGVFASLIGDFFLRDSVKLVNSIMLFAGGGIIYLIFQDIAPLSKIKNEWFPATGASIGFLLGMIGEKLLK